MSLRGRPTPAAITPFLVIAVAVILSATIALSHSATEIGIDTPYLHAAGHCLWHGVLPYDTEGFRACWQETTGGAPYESAFVYTPIILPVALLIGPFDWPLAQAIYDWLQVGVIGLLGFALMNTMGLRALSGVAALSGCGWLLLALTGTGVFVNLNVGQVAGFTALGAVLMVLGYRQTNGWLFALGTLLALIKPHLTWALVLCLWAAPPWFLWRAKCAVMGGLAALFAGLMLLDPQLLSHYQASLAEHLSNRHSYLPDLELLTGAAGLLDMLSQMAAVEVVGVTLGLAVLTASALWLITQQIERIEPFWSLVAALCLLGLFAVPHKPYDFTVFALVFAAMVRLPFRAQAVLLGPLLIIWRPQLLWSLFGAEVPIILIVNLAILGLGLGFAALALLAWRHNASRP